MCASSFITGSSDFFFTPGDHVFFLNNCMFLPLLSLSCVFSIFLANFTFSLYEPGAFHPALPSCFLSQG